MSVDYKVFELAELFLMDQTDDVNTQDNREKLAIAIQSTIESELELMIDEANKRKEGA